MSSLRDRIGRDSMSSVDFTARGLGRRLAVLRAAWRDVVNVKDFGALGDGVTNDTAAFAAASAKINAAGGGSLIVPPGTYIVGKQTLAGVTGGAWAYTPADIIRITNCVRPVAIIGHGARLVCAVGLKFGSFNPVTGAVHNPTLPFYSTDYRASPYVAMIHVTNCASVRIAGFELNGASAGLTLGGFYGDTGWQINASGYEIYGCGRLQIEDVYTHHHALDGGMIGYIGLTDASHKKPVKIVNVVHDYNARQGLSWVGGNGLTAINCVFSRTGRGTFTSAPGAGLDIEAESSICRNGVFIDCEFVNNVGVGLLSHVGSDNEDFTAILCKFVGTTNWSCWPNDPGWKFHDCLFVGTLTNPHNNVDHPERSTQFYNCRFSAAPALSETGVVYYNNYLTVEVTAANVQFDRCSFMADGVVTKPLCYISGATVRDCSFDQDGTGESVFRATYWGRTTIVTAGTSSFVPYTVYGELVINGNRTARNFDHLLETGNVVKIGGTTVLAGQGAAIAAPSGGTTIDAESRTAIGLILARMRASTPSIAL